MLAGQKLKGQNGYEVALFPCEALYLTESRVPPEHDVLALDFLPYTIEEQKITAMPCYAPFSGTVVYTGNDHNLILESDDLVNWADGSLAKMRVLVAHSFEAPVLNSHFNQGDLFYKTGNFGNSFGEHLHIEVSKAEGRYFDSSGIGLNGGVHMWNALYVNNTVLLRPLDFNWLEFSGGVVPSKNKKKRRYPFFMYKKNYLDIKIR